MRKRESEERVRRVIGEEQGDERDVDYFHCSQRKKCGSRSNWSWRRS